MVRRFVTEIDPAHKRTYAIAMRLHPCFKNGLDEDAHDFIDAAADNVWSLQ